MTCSSPNSTPDWKAYALGELDHAARQLAETHAAGCDGCREELAMLRLTLDTLSTLPEVELPRRIAFVSDPVFEKPAGAPWWQTLFNPTFAAASVLAAAILMHGYMGNSAANETVINARVEAAVAKQVAEIEARQEIIVTKMEQQERGLMRVQNAGLVRY